MNGLITINGKNAYDLDFSIAKLNDGNYVAYAKRNLTLNKELLNKIKAMTREQILQLTIADLPLTHRASHYLACDNIETVEDLIKSRTRKELLRIPNFGQKCIKEVEQVLARLGLALETN